MRRFFLFTLWSLMCPVLFAQNSTDYVGTWEGTLNVGTDLRLVFHIATDAKGDLKATADSPTQGAFGLPCDTVIFSAGSIKIEMNTVGASYSGKVNGDSMIVGNFHQGMDLPLNLKKVISKSSINEVGESNQDSKPVEIKTADVTLSGSLLNPPDARKLDVVLIIAGSGPTDRDGNSAGMPGKNNSLLQLADSLSAAGIASLRYDKRGIGKSIINSGFKEELITIDDMVNDAQLFYDWLKKEGFKNVFVAGHSEGSLVALLLAQKIKPAGLISIAGAGRKADHIIAEQLSAQLSAQELQFFKNAADSIQKGYIIKNVPQNLQALLRESVQPYLRSWFVHDPQNLISKLKCPVLIVQGKKDIQVTETDATRLKAGLSSAKLSLIDNMHHVLKDVESDNRAENINAYSDPSLALNTQLVRDIVTFIKTTKK